MKFEEALRNFQVALYEEYGFDNAVVKIGLEPKVFERVVFDLYQKTHVAIKRKKKVESTTFSFRLADAGEVIVYGTQILARERDRF